MPQHHPTYIYTDPQGRERALQSKTGAPLTQEEIAARGTEYFGEGTTFSRSVLPPRPQSQIQKAVALLNKPSPINPLDLYERYVSRPVTRGAEQYLSNLIDPTLAAPALGKEPGQVSLAPAAPGIARAVIPQTGTEALATLTAPLGGAVTSRTIPRLAKFLGHVAGGSAPGLATGDLSEAAWSGGAGGAAGLLSWLKGVASRQLPGGSIRAGRAMAPEVGATMERAVPILAGAKTPADLYRMGRGLPGAGPQIPTRLVGMYGEMLDRMGIAVGNRPLMIPSLMSPEGVMHIAALRQNLATAAITRPGWSQSRVAQQVQRAQADLDTAIQRWGVPFENVHAQIKAGGQAFRSPSQSLGAQRGRASVGQLIDELDDALAEIQLPPEVLADFTKTRRLYRAGKAFGDLLNPEGLYSPRSGLRPEALQSQFAKMTAEEGSQGLAARLGPNVHTQLADVLTRGAVPPGGGPATLSERDVVGFLPRALHAVVGSAALPKGYFSTGGLGEGSKGVVSRFISAPGRQPGEISSVGRALLAIAAQRGRTTVEEENVPAVE